MNSAQRDFQQSYQQELRAQNRSPAPQLTLRVDNKEITIPVTIRTSPLSDFERGDDSILQNTSTHELTLALVVENEGADLAAILLNRYTRERQREDNHTSTRAIALLLNQLTHLCGAAAPLLFKRGEKLTAQLTNQHVTDLATRIAQESHEANQQHQD